MEDDMWKETAEEAMKDLRSSSQDITGCALVAQDGQILASSLKPGVDPARMGAVSVAALKLGEEAAGGLECGALQQLTLKGEGGYVLLIREGDDAVLCIMTRSSAKVGLVLQDARRTVSSITAAR